MSQKGIVDDNFSFIKVVPKMTKKTSEDGRRVSQKNDITEELKQYGMQIGYAFNKWGTPKTIDLMTNVPAYILGQNLTPQKIYSTDQPNSSSRVSSNISDNNNNNNNNTQNQIVQLGIVRVDIQQNGDNLSTSDTDQLGIKKIISNRDNEEETEKERRSKSKQMLQIYTNTILFTYRKNFQQLLDEVQDNPEVKNLTSDSGWGCMIRVGQMIFAQAMKRHLKKINSIDAHQLINIIIGFLEDNDNDTHPYSIHQVTNLAYKKYKILPGSWYTPVQICYILKDLHKKKKMKGTENLKVAVHGSDKPIVFEKILNKMLGTKKKITCNHVNPISRNSTKNQFLSDDSFEKIGQCYENEQEIECSEENEENCTDTLCCTECCQTNNKLLLLIPSRVGMDEIIPPHLEIIKRLMSLEFSIGMIGGKPNKAHYFVGIINNELIYLDPHWIQEYIPADQLIQNLQSYFPNDVCKVNINKISTSLVFGFYFSSISELNCFYKQMRQLENEFKDDFFLVIEKSTPSYDYCTQSEIKKLQNTYQNSYAEKMLSDLGIDKNQYENCEEALEEDESSDDSMEQCYLDEQGQNEDIDKEYKPAVNKINYLLKKQNYDEQDNELENQYKYFKSGFPEGSSKKQQILKSQSDEDLQKLKMLYYQKNNKFNEIENQGINQTSQKDK